MKEFLDEIHSLIFTHSLNIFDLWALTTISSLATEYSGWCWLLLIPCVIVSIRENNKLL